MAVSTGSRVLDRMLDGGFPEQRSVLVTGGPGVGKSTLGMQFLQEGLKTDEECLYVSTEQTTEEIRSSFENFTFDFEHQNLTIGSIHARSGKTLETGAEELTLQTLEGDEMLGGGYSAPLESQYVEEYLTRFGPCDRIVFDSVSGLNLISEDPYEFRRTVLDLIRLFADEFEATTIFTAEGFNPDGEPAGGPSITTSDVLEFATHGVIRMWWERIQGNRRRQLQILKMRGIDHDTREYEVSIGDEGINLTPHIRSGGQMYGDLELIPTGIKGMDRLCGGLVKGSGVLLEHDGRALVDGLVVGMAVSAFKNGLGVWLVPSPSLTPSRVERMLPSDVGTVEGLLEKDRLFVLDSFSIWNEHADNRNVYLASTGGPFKRLLGKSSFMSKTFVKRVLREISNRRDEAVLATVYTEAFLRWFDAPEVRELYYWARESVSFPNDIVVYIHNPSTMEEKLAEFFVYDAQEMFRTWKEDSGIQYLRAEKTPEGDTGALGVVDHTEAEPFVRID
ncbi:MAG: RAD55 family ATPase [Halobacteriales archaeon]